MRRQLDLVQIALYLMNQKGKKGSHGGHGGHGVAEDLPPIPVKQCFPYTIHRFAPKTEDRIEKAEHTEYRIPNSNSEPRTPNHEPRTPNRTANAEL